MEVVVRQYREQLLQMARWPGAGLPAVRPPDTEDLPDRLPELERPHLLLQVPPYPPPL